MSPQGRALHVSGCPLYFISPRCSGLAYFVNCISYFVLDKGLSGGVIYVHTNLYCTMSDEKTLILFKPDCVRKNLSGIILQRLLAEGFRLRGLKMMQLDDAILREHYGHIIDLVIDGEPLFPKLSAFMQTSPVVALVLSGPGVITRVRTILGPTNSMKADKGTIRGDFGTNSMLNICHASDSPESAEAEVARFFKPEELFDNVF